MYCILDSTCKQYHVVSVLVWFSSLSVIISRSIHVAAMALFHSFYGWDCKDIQPVHSKGHQSWVFFGRNDAEAETLVLWPPHAKSWLIGKDSDAGRDWGQEEKGRTEDEMARIASLTRWTWVWVNSGSFVMDREAWCAAIHGVTKVRHDWVTELNWTIKYTQIWKDEIYQKLCARTQTHTLMDHE